jgi:hypothetical protein
MLLPVNKYLMKKINWVKIYNAASLFRLIINNAQMKNLYLKLQNYLEWF